MDCESILFSLAKFSVCKPKEMGEGRGVNSSLNQTVDVNKPSKCVAQTAAEKGHKNVPNLAEKMDGLAKKGVINGIRK
jgi:hypothetical protein